MQTEVFSLGLTDLAVHAHGIVFADVVSHLQDFHTDSPGAELDLELVAHLHIVGCLGGAAVDHDTGVVTGFIGHGAALDQTGDLGIRNFSYKIGKARKPLISLG